MSSHLSTASPPSLSGPFPVGGQSLESGRLLNNDGATMGSTRRSFTAEYKKQAVQLVLDGTPIITVAKHIVYTK